MFWRFKQTEDNRDKFGRTFDEAFKEHARWCIDTLRNNVPDEQAIQYIWNNSPSLVERPPEFREFFVGDAVFNACAEIKTRLEDFKQFYSPEEIEWIGTWMKKDADVLDMSIPSREKTNSYS
mgnify:FL=1